MSRSKRDKQKESKDEEMNESWLLPYADLLTLLLALFIVLFAMSSVDAQKFQSMSNIFNEIFSGGTGIIDRSALLENGQHEKTNVPSSREENPLEVVQEKINQYITENDLSDQLTTSLTSEGLLLTINDNVFFDSGSAEVREEDILIAKEISELLVMDPPSNIIISGHTDNVPIHNSLYSSNWELSAMRAVNFMKIILENPNLNPSLFSAKGHGEYNPIASNDTEEGKAKNRRVEVLIQPTNQDEMAE